MKAALAAGAAPALVPASVFGANAPSNKVQIAILGCGRVAATFDMYGLAANHDIAMLATICDVDSERLPYFKELAKNMQGGKVLWLYIIGQVFNIALTLFAVWILLSGVVFDVPVLDLYK